MMVWWNMLAQTEGAGENPGFILLAVIFAALGINAAILFIFNVIALCRWILSPDHTLRLADKIGLCLVMLEILAVCYYLVSEIIIPTH